MSTFSMTPPHAGDTATLLDGRVLVGVPGVPMQVNAAEALILGGRGWTGTFPHCQFGWLTVTDNGAPPVLYNGQMVNPFTLVPV